MSEGSDHTNREVRFPWSRQHHEGWPGKKEKNVELRMRLLRPSLIKP